MDDDDDHANKKKVHYAIKFKKISANDLVTTMGFSVSFFFLI